MKKKSVLFVILIFVLVCAGAFAEEYYPTEISVDGNTVTWEDIGEVELQRLSPDKEWVTIYGGDKNSYTDSPPVGLNYYRVRNIEEEEYKYSAGIFEKDPSEAVCGWRYCESNTSGNLQYTVSKTDSGTCRIEKTSAYASGDYGGISQTISSDKLETGKSYTLSFEHKRIGGSTAYNQIYYSLGGSKTAISPKKGQTVDWKTTEKSFVCSDKDDFTLCFYIVGVGVSLELDNIKLYESGDETQTNLLLNADFESEKTVPKAPSTAAVLADDIISWTAEGGIVVTEGTNNYPIAVFSRDKQIGKLASQSNVYILRAYSESGGISNPYLLSAEGESFITEPSFSAKKAEGAVDVSIKVKNKTRKEGLSVGLYTALYKSGKLISVSGVSQKSPYSGDDNSFTMIRATCNVPNDGGEYEIKAFVWSGIGTMLPMTATKKITSGKE